MKIDLQITFNDLSEECKKEIKRLQDAGYDVNIIYPSIQKKKDEFDKYFYPEWPKEFGPTIEPEINLPYIVKCYYKGK